MAARRAVAENVIFCPTGTAACTNSYTVYSMYDVVRISESCACGELLDGSVERARGHLYSLWLCAVAHTRHAPARVGRGSRDVLVST